MALPTGVLHADSLLDKLLAASMVVVAIAFGIFVFFQTGTGHLTSYPLTARLSDAGGLAWGADVRVNGIKVGRITNLSLQGRPAQALILMQIRDDLFLPVDSTVRVETSVMGNIYLAIKPGGDSHTIPPGGVVGPVPPRPSASAPPSSRHP